MRIPRIFTEQALSQGQTLLLEEGPSRHLSKVLRMGPGRELILFNGQGGEYQATITTVNKKTVEVSVTTHNELDRQYPLDINLAIGVSRGERFDWVLQKATELGVTRITPLITERTEVKLTGDRLQKKLQHWQHITISACEQCQLNQLPQIATPQKIDSWLEEAKQYAGLKLVLHHRSDKSLAEHSQPEQLTLLIGPEGGLSEREIALAEERGFAPLTLGPRVLRTETAPVVALSLLQYLWGDL